jgi:hypothetical protein
MAMRPLCHLCYGQIQGYDVTIFPMRGKKGGVILFVLILEKNAALSSPPFVVRGRRRLLVAKQLLA